MGVKLSDLGNNGEIYRKNLYLVGKMLVQRLLRIWLVEPLATITGYTRELNAILKPVHDFTKSIISQRKINYASVKRFGASEKSDEAENVYFRSKKRRYAMMDTLLQAQSEGLIDDEGIIEETDTFTFEGHDTTSAAMTFTLLLLAHHPETQERIFQELQDALNDEDIKSLTIEDLNKMEYLDRVIKESLRLYPPVTFISREFSEDFHHDGVTYPKASFCNIHIYDLHRDPEVFPDPETFDPDRFLPENCINRSNFAFIAFSAGMRNCIGQRFAMLELKIVLAQLVKSFKILPVTTREEVVFVADLVIRSKFPIKMIFEMR